MAPASFIWRTFEWQFQDHTYRFEVSKNGSQARFLSREPDQTGANASDGDGNTAKDVQLLEMPMAVWVALSDAVSQTRAQERRSGLPARAGKSWSQVECQKVARAFENGVAIENIANQQNRTEGAIIARLAQLGLIDRETFAHPSLLTIKDTKPNLQTGICPSPSH